MSALRHAAILALACMAALCGAAEARWNGGHGASPELRGWFEQQHNSRGQWCCRHGDGHAFYGAYTINSDGSVTLELRRGSRTLPAYMVLHGPNPTGHAVYWYRDYGTVRLDYCFSPGTLS